MVFDIRMQPKLTVNFLHELAERGNLLARARDVVAIEILAGDRERRDVIVADHPANGGLQQLAIIDEHNQHSRSQQKELSPASTPSVNAHTFGRVSGGGSRTSRSTASWRLIRRRRRARMVSTDCSEGAPTGRSLLMPPPCGWDHAAAEVHDVINAGQLRFEPLRTRTRRNSIEAAVQTENRSALSGTGGGCLAAASRPHKCNSVK